MHILSLHNRYQIRGGEDECQIAETALLREYGHSVDVYEETNDRIPSLGTVQTGIRTIWSQESYQIVQQHLKEHRYDILHSQNLFPLISPSVYYAARAAGIPVVQTLHNYRLLCPNALFFRDGRVCEDCLGKPIPYPGALHGCYRESRIATSSVATMISVHRALQTWTEMVDIYIALTEFARQKFIQGGLPAHKIVVKPNFVHPDPGVGTGTGGYALFVGRLSVEKGLDTLLAAWEKLAKVSPPIPLKIVGDGPLSDRVQAAAEKLPNVEWLGRRSLPDVLDLIGNAQMVVFPSTWYETFGRVAVEAFAKGTPVIAAKIGAIAELVEHDRTGLHFQPGDPDDLAAQVEWMMAHPAAVAQMRKAARAEFEAHYTAEKNYQKLMEIYAQARAGFPQPAHATLVPNNS